MKLISDELYELMMDNIEDRDALCSALEIDVNYWESCLKAHPNDKPEILRHIRNYIARDKELMKVFAR